MFTSIKVLVVGDGGREAELVLKVEQSNSVSQVYCIAADQDVVHYAKAKNIGLVIIGPEAPLVDGVVDKLRKVGIPAFGPNRLAARIEGSKIFTKSRCNAWGIPTARFDFAGDFKVARRMIKNVDRLGNKIYDFDLRVIKADGLCAGKGVRVTHSEEEAIEAAHEMLIDRVHGSAGSKIVLEEKLEGIECSYMAFCDGSNKRRLPLSKDEKRLRAGTDIMTGGVGAHSPVSEITEEQITEIESKIVDPLIAGMSMAGKKYFHETQWKDCVGTPFQGLLYVGIMITKDGPKLIEVNGRFGDPETQVVLPRLKSDIVPYLLACTTLGGLAALPELEVKKQAAACVVLFSPDYPRSGKRLHSVVGFGDTPANAYAGVYARLREERPNAFYRDDM